MFLLLAVTGCGGELVEQMPDLIALPNADLMLECIGVSAKCMDNSQCCTGACGNAGTGASYCCTAQLGTSCTTAHECCPYAPGTTTEIRCVPTDSTLTAARCCQHGYEFCPAGSAGEGGKRGWYDCGAGKFFADPQQCD